jgi:rSAM/selenodomain-associated transferase 1
MPQRKILKGDGTGTCSSSIKNCVILFVKFPDKGKVKTRLSQFIGEKLTLDLYKTFVADILDKLDQRHNYNIKIAFYPHNSKRKIIPWLGKQYSYIPQRGKSLGERMANVFKQIFSEGFGKAIIIGSDIPDLPLSLITKAFISLNNRDAVIGPSLDGGYYLIGFRHDAFSPSVFKGIEWGTDAVFSQTLDRFGKTHIVQILPLWKDIDQLMDIKDLLERSRNTPFENSKTISFIKSKKEILEYFRESTQ